MLVLWGRSLTNRPDDPEYTLRLIGQVITVSLETVEIVNALPDLGLSKGENVESSTTAKATQCNEHENQKRLLGAITG